jgi:hypothetical protein
MKKNAAVRLAAVAGTALTALCSLGHAQTTAMWLNPVSGTWSDATKWSTNPQVPNNVAGSTFNAVISQTGAAHFVDLDLNVAINNLTLSSADATLQLKARAQVERTRAFNSGQSSGLMGQRSRQAREEFEPISEPISGHSSGLTDGRRSRTPRRAARTSAVSSARFELTPPPQTRTTTTVAAAANAPTGATGEQR